MNVTAAAMPAANATANPEDPGCLLTVSLRSLVSMGPPLSIIIHSHIYKSFYFYHSKETSKTTAQRTPPPSPGTAWSPADSGPAGSSGSTSARHSAHRGTPLSPCQFPFEYSVLQTVGSA